MDIKSAEESFQNVTFEDDSYQKLLNHLQGNQNDENYHLCLLIGDADDNKEEALQHISERSNRDVYAINANDVISKIESESYEHIDRIFNKFNPKQHLFYLQNGSRLCGSYTGYTQSSVKYATPQERYFLNKVQETGGLYVIDISVPTDTDNTLRRAAQSIINFSKPQSGLKKLFWRLKQISVHGHQIKTERPENYGKQSGNF